MTESRVLSIVPKDFNASLLWRSWWPIDELNKHDVVADWCYVDNYAEDIEPKLKSGKYNTVVTPRFNFSEQWMLQQFIRTLKRYDITWIYELDDDTLSPYIVPRNVAFNLDQYKYPEYTDKQKHDYLQANQEFQRQMRLQQLSYIDGLTVSTPQLATVAATYTQAPVYVVGNAINIDWFNLRKDSNKRTIAPLTIGWSGGWRYDADLEILAQAWTIIAQRYPDVSFVIYGFESPSIIKAIPANRLSVIGWSNLDDYPSILSNIDIGCCSIADNQWNSNKTAIKWYEMTLAGATCVASHALYGQEIMDGYDGLLATSVRQWVDHLSTLIDDPWQRRTIHSQAMQTIKAQHNIKHAWPQWLHAWDSIREQHTLKAT